MAGGRFSKVLDYVFARKRQSTWQKQRRRTLAVETLEQRQLLNGDPVANWTVMIYMAADNDLEQYALADFREMAAINNPDGEVNIVVQMDRAKNYDKNDGNWTTAKRFEVDYLMTPIAANQVEPDLGEVNMGDPNTLVSFVNWATTTFPATHNALILWDHGGGWQYGTCYDEASKDWLTMSDLKTALAQVPKLDVLAIDACFMGEVEVAYQLSSYCDYFVASADTIPYAGYDYKAVLSRGTLTVGTDPRAWSESLVSTYDASYDSNWQTLVAADMSQFGSAASNFSNLATALKNNLTTERTAIQAAYAASRDYDSGNAIDLYNFCSALSSNAAVGSAAGALMLSLDQLTVAKTGTAWGGYNAGGLSVFFPASSVALKGYSTLDFVQTGSPGQPWLDFLTAYLKKPGGGGKGNNAGRDLDGKGAADVPPAIETDPAVAAVALFAGGTAWSEGSGFGVFTADTVQARVDAPAVESRPVGESGRTACGSAGFGDGLASDLAGPRNGDSWSRTRDAALQSLLAEDDALGLHASVAGHRPVGWNADPLHRKLNKTIRA